MARAKRTDRAEARRRYRAEQGIIDGEDESVDGDLEKAPAKPQATVTAAPRIGLRAAFSQAFRPVDVRADLQSVPTVLIRSKALWIPLGVTLAAFGLVAVVGTGDAGMLSIVATLLYQYFLFTPAIGGAFLAGFLAPRASWLLGAVVGLVAAICFTILVLVFPEQISGTSLPGAEASRELIIAAFTLSPVMGALFASAAAWYRRFLYLSKSQSRARPAGAEQPLGRQEPNERAEQGEHRPLISGI